MARRRENMLEAFKASRDQALEERRQALAPPAESVAQRLQRSLQKTLPKAGERRGEEPPKLRVKDHSKAKSESKAAEGELNAGIAVDVELNSAPAPSDSSVTDPQGKTPAAKSDSESVNPQGEAGDEALSVANSSQAETTTGPQAGSQTATPPRESMAPAQGSATAAAKGSQLPGSGSGATTERATQVTHLPGVGNGFLVAPKFLLAYSLTLAALSFVLGWQFGSAGSPSENADEAVQAAGVPQVLPDPLALPGQEPSQAPAPAASEATAADLAFANPDNHWTLVVDQFTNNRPGRERAVHHYRYLRDQGFPVIQPRARGPVVFLLVGAAPGKADLSDLLGQVRIQPYPGSQDRTFSSVYPERISDFF